MTNYLSNGTGRWTTRPFHVAMLGILVAQLAFYSGAIAKEQPESDSYAHLPELSGPFSELKDLPESLKEFSIVRTPDNEFAILPTSLRLYPNASAFRLEHNLLSAAGITPGPMARLEFFVQPTVNDVASVVLAISKAFPRAKIGRPRITRALVPELLVSDVFGTRHTETVLPFGQDFSVNDVVLVTFEPSPLFMRAMAGDGSILGVRISYEISTQDQPRQYSIGMSYAFNCRMSPESFLDLANSKYGCPNYELWKLASPGALNDRLSECVSAAGIPSPMPEGVVSRWKEWKRSDCAMTVLRR